MEETKLSANEAWTLAALRKEFLEAHGESPTKGEVEILRRIVKTNTSFIKAMRNGINKGANV